MSRLRDRWRRRFPSRNTADHSAAAFLDQPGAARRARDVRDIAIDRLGAEGFLTRLQEHGLPVAQFGQGFVSMSAPCKEIERAILGRQFKAGGDPILRWNIANIRVELDAAGNIKFAKHKWVGKIDGAFAVACRWRTRPARRFTNGRDPRASFFV
jgi:phage terminase large subunit-like protein